MPDYLRDSCTVAGVELDVFSGGRGETLLILHDYEFVNGWWPFMKLLAQRFSIVAPSHPGFGSSSLRPEFDSVDDLAHLYLEFLRDFQAPVHLMGLGLGGWIAAEVAVRSTQRLQSLILVDAVGIKISEPTSRDIADTFVLGPEEILALTWHDQETGRAQMRLPGLGDLSEDELVLLLRNRESAALFCWKPFMHNPKLRARLRAIDVPTLVLWGESDRLVSPQYGQAYADGISGATFQIVRSAGHYPYLEQPEAFVELAKRFLFTKKAAVRTG